MLQEWWRLAFLIGMVILGQSVARPRWLEGNVQHDNNQEQQKSSYWSSIFGGAKDQIESLFKGGNDAPGGGESSTVVNRGIFSGVKRALNKLIHKDQKEPASPHPPAVVKTMSEQEINALVETANAHLEKGDMNAVIDTFFAVLDADPTRVDINTVLGTIFMNMEKRDLAEGFLYAAVQQSNWTYAPAVATLAQTLRLDGDLDLSEKVAVRGLNVAGGRDETGQLSHALGVVTAMKGQWNVSADWFLAAALNKPTEVDYWLQASTISFPTPHWDLKFAENVLLQGLTYHPTNARLHYQLGQAMVYTNRMTESIPFFEESLRLDPDLHPVKPLLATAYHSVRQFVEANAMYADAVQRDQTNVVLMSNYALLLCTEFVDQRDTGSNLVAHAKTLDPTNADVLRADAACSSERNRDSRVEL
jgi:Tfp pilus assembly protein PilF